MTPGATRFPHDAGYVAHLGAAVYAFAYHEWLLVEILRLLDPVVTIEDATRTPSGPFARRLSDALAAAQLPPELHQDIGRRFLDLVERRNDIIHAHPATTPDGEQRLYRWAPARGRVAFVSDDVLASFIEDVEQLNRDANTLRTHLRAAPSRRAAE